MARYVKRRRIVLSAVAALIVGAVVVGGAVASFPQDNVKLYTGCLTSGGNINYIKEGDNPLQTCSSPKQIVKLSGGDITSVNTPAGSGLSGGSDNGAVTLRLDAAHSLPQGCTSGQVVKSIGSNTWNCGNDNDTTYTAGTGLDLSAPPANAFSIESAYRVPGKVCSTSGQFATGFDSSGNIQCTAPAATSLDTFDKFAADQGIPDTNLFDTTIVSIDPSAGNYFVIAEGTITSENNVDSGESVTCRIKNSGENNFVDALPRLSSDTLNAVDDVPFSLFGFTSVAAGDTISMTCNASDGADGIGIKHPEVLGIKIG